MQTSSLHFLLPSWFLTMHTFDIFSHLFASPVGYTRIMSPIRTILRNTVFQWGWWAWAKINANSKVDARHLVWQLMYHENGHVHHNKFDCCFTPHAKHGTFSFGFICTKRALFMVYFKNFLHRRRHALSLSQNYATHIHIQFDGIITCS